MILTATDKELAKLEKLFLDALLTDGAHHKQWYLERISILLGLTVVDDYTYEKGIAP